MSANFEPAKTKSMASAATYSDTHGSQVDTPRIAARVPHLTGGVFQAKVPITQQSSTKLLRFFVVFFLWAKKEGHKRTDPT